MVFESGNYLSVNVDIHIRCGSRPVYQVCTNLSDFLGIGSTLNNSRNIFILNLNQFNCLSLFQWIFILHHNQA